MRAKPKVVCPMRGRCAKKEKKTKCCAASGIEKLRFLKRWCGTQSEINYTVQSENAKEGAADFSACVLEALAGFRYNVS